MRTILGALPLGLLLFACSSDPASPDRGPGADAGWSTTPATSGSRLRAKLIVGGGARELVGFYDTARNEECRFQETNDGRFFCLPPSVNASLSGGFGDAACKEAVAFLSGGCGADAKYTATFSSDRCGAFITGLRKVERTASTVYFQQSPSCVAQPQSTNPNPNIAVVVSNVIPFDQFVEAQITTVQKGALTERIAVAADGARQHLGYRSTALDADCTFQIMADGVTRCVPQASSGQIIYSDSECTKPAAALNTTAAGTCGSSAVVVREVAPSSGCASAFYSVKAESTTLDLDSAYIGSPTSSGVSCSSSYRPSSSTAFAIANVTSSLQTVSRVGSANGRLAPALVSGPVADSLVPGWHDMERNVDCTFAKASDGKIRCLPSGGGGLVFYTDNACKASTRIAAVTGQRGCAETPKFIRVADGAATCAPNQPGQPPVQTTNGVDVTTRVFAISGQPRNVGVSSVETSPGRCVQVAGVLGAVDAVEVNAADFVEATVVTE
jgi:hypothetical protein